MPYNEIIEGARVRTDTTIAIDKIAAKTLWGAPKPFKNHQTPSTL